MPPTAPGSVDPVSVPGSIAPLRLGHAYWSNPKSSDTEDIEEVLEILTGAKVLSFRAPAVPDAVLRAEAILGAKERPIYTFVGCLHPKLGSIGLIIAPDCLVDCLQGASRCDTGGLALRKGGFRHVDEVVVEITLKDLSFEAASLTWCQEMHSELDASYSGCWQYVQGTLPNYSGWKDPRFTCIKNSVGTDDLDRRLWTWEVRLRQAPKPAAFECVVVSPEAFKRLEALRLTKGSTPPTSVRVLHGRATPTGIHHFEENTVFNALAGAMP